MRIGAVVVDCSSCTVAAVLEVGVGDFGIAVGNFGFGFDIAVAAAFVETGLSSDLNLD